VINGQISRFKAVKAHVFESVLDRKKSRKMEHPISDKIDIEIDLGVDDEQGEEKEVTQEVLDQIFKPITAKEVYDKKINYRTIKIPPNRLSPLKSQWLEIYKPIVEYLKLQVRFNTKTLNVEIRV
jgi:hypothetical protein